MKYAIITFNNNGLFLGVDRNSGGYPFKTERVDCAKIWAQPFFNDLLDYLRHIPSYFGSYTIRFIDISTKTTVEEIKALCS
jgi:hypothetical protein